MSRSHLITQDKIIMAAMNAVQQSAPFKPLPSEYKKQDIIIEITFDDHVLNSIALPMQNLEQCKTKLCKFICGHK